MRQDRIILLLVVAVVMLSALLVTGVGYALETDNIIVSDNPQLTAEQSDFKIEFMGEPTYSGKGVTELKITGSTTAEINVTGLNNVGDFGKAIVTIGNKSSDLYAELNAKVTNTNTEYFKVSCDLSETYLEPRTGRTILKITVELIKLPIEKDETSHISIDVIANPIYN